MLYRESIRRKDTKNIITMCLVPFILFYSFKGKKIQ